MKRMFLMAIFAIVLSFSQNAEACTGITLRTISGSTVTARTIEWAGNDLESKYSIVPRGYSQRSFTPDGKKDGMMFTAKYGYVGLAVEQASRLRHPCRAWQRGDAHFLTTKHYL